MSKYRTDEQYDNIVENCINGNWSSAFNIAEKGGWYASDLISEHELRLNTENITFDDPLDIALVVEGAWRVRIKNK